MQGIIYEILYSKLNETSTIQEMMPPILPKIRINPKRSWRISAILFFLRKHHFFFFNLNFEQCDVLAADVHSFMVRRVYVECNSNKNISYKFSQVSVSMEEIMLLFCNASNF